jgi:DNA-binding FrmR family transcriptional regulator
MKPIVNRLKRVEGQLQKIRTDLEDGALSCDTAVPQFLAAKGALDACVKEYLLLSLKACGGKRSQEEMTMLLETIVKKL